MPMLGSVLLLLLASLTPLSFQCARKILSPQHLWTATLHLNSFGTPSWDRKLSNICYAIDATCNWSSRESHNYHCKSVQTNLLTVVAWFFSNSMEQMRKQLCENSLKSRWVDKYKWMIYILNICSGLIEVCKKFFTRNPKHPRLIFGEAYTFGRISRLV